MAYCTVAELKAYMGQPGAGASAASGLRTSSGTAVDDSRWSDAFIESVIDAGAADIDGYIGRNTTIPAASAKAKMLNLLYAAAFLATADVPEHIAEGGRTRAEALWKEYNRQSREAYNNPQIMGGTVDTFSYHYE